MTSLIRYWFEFDLLEEKVPLNVRLGCGVTAFTYGDAIHILKEKIFKGAHDLPIKKVTENIDVSTLDQGHVIPNMMPPNVRGIWYPMGYVS